MAQLQIRPAIRIPAGHRTWSAVVSESSMRILRGFTDPTAYRGGYVSIGNFDGVHRGHQKMIGTLVDHARRAGVSVSQLERDFMALFGVPPRRYLAKVRLDAALEMLLTDAPLADIAQACGYADQSAFGRRFQAALGMSPSRYRHARREAAAPS